jgi:hypothetical protein
MPSKDSNDDHFIPDVSEPVILPRAKVATIQRHPTSTMFHSRHSSSPQVLSSADLNIILFHEVPLNTAKCFNTIVH